MATALKSFWREPPKGRFLNLREIFGLGSAGLGVSFICNIVNAYVTTGYLPVLYDLGRYGTLHATILYITACTAGLILLLVYVLGGGPAQWEQDKKRLRIRMQDVPGTNMPLVFDVQVD